MKREANMVGVLYAIAAFGFWGFLPLYWKALETVPAQQILAHRIFWSCIFVVGIIAFYKRWNVVREVFYNKGKVLLIFLSALLISANWFIFIWAVNAGKVVEASLGYYINPLFSVLLGVVFLKESLNFCQRIALLLAFCGVMVITLHYGTIPWIAISLALSFGFYGLAKKVANNDSMTSLLLETAFVAPIALIFLVSEGIQGHSDLSGASTKVIALLVGSGVVTALPLLWFAQSTSRIPLSTVGFIQYLAPTINLSIGVFVFREPFTNAHLISYFFIWSAIILFSLSKVTLFNKSRVKTGDRVL